MYPFKKLFNKRLCIFLFIFSEEKIKAVKTFKFIAITMTLFFSITGFAQTKLKPEKAQMQFNIYEKGQYMTKVDVRKEKRGTENIV